MKNDIDSILDTLFSGGKLNVGSGTKSRAAKDAEDFLNSIEKTNANMQSSLNRQISDLDKLTSDAQRSMDEMRRLLDAEGLTGTPEMEAPKAETAEKKPKAKGAEEPPQDPAQSFREAREATGRTVIGQDAFLDSLFTAFRRPSVTGRENGKPAAVVVISGKEGTGRHSALAASAAALCKEGVLKNGEVTNIDLSRYPNAEDGKLLTQDLFSALHSEILKDSVFHDFYTEWPNKFKNVTNGIAHRRWLNQSNPELASLITELTGDGFIHDAAQLEKLMKYKDDTSVQKKLAEIKLHNKQRLAEHVKRTQGQIVDPNSIFDVQVKRLHEYKRQHMNALHILSVYQWLLENPNADYTPHTFFFGAKAAPGYYFAKEILQFIVCLADTINDPRVNQKLRVIFVENYCVSWAELLTPAAEISEQISLAGTEASGTSNMKFMINGAITLGTLDGANVEIHDAVGDDNIILFGMTTPEVNSLRASGYNPRNQYEHNDIIRKAMDALGQGFNGKTFQNLHQALLNVDQYMALADFASYSHAQQKANSFIRTRPSGTLCPLSTPQRQAFSLPTAPSAIMRTPFGSQSRSRRKPRRKRSNIT